MSAKFVGVFILLFLIVACIPVQAGSASTDPQDLIHPAVYSPDIEPSGCTFCDEAGCVEDNETPVTEAEVNSEVDAINAEIQENGWDWVAGPTSIMFLSEETRNLMRNWELENNAVFEDVIPEEPPDAEIEALPRSFSWKNQGGKNYLTPVKYQGKCGSCWAFGITAAFESYWEIKKNKPGMNPNFAEQVLVSCAKDQNGCNGGNIHAMKYLVKKRLGNKPGTVKEGAYPYVAKKTACKNLGTTRRFRAARWAYVGGGSEYVIPSVKAIKHAIYTKGPIVAGVYADNKFDAYQSGIFQSKPTNNNYYGNHIVLIYGWSMKNGKTVWKCKNSWGTNWGENGYFRIYAGYNRIGEGAAFFSAS